MTKAPTPSYQPTTTYPTLSPTTTSEFRWQAGIYYEGGPINANTTYIYNVFYGNWNGVSGFYRCIPLAFITIFI